MINIKKNISVKSFYRFVEFVSKLCGSKLPHERYKQIALDIIEAQSEEEANAKRLSNAFLYVLNNSKQSLGKEQLNNIYYLLTNDFIDDIVINKLLKRYYVNINCDVEHKVLYIHNYIISLEIKRKIEFAFLISSYLMIKEERGALVPFCAIFDEYLVNIKMGDEARLLFLFKQMEDSSEDDQSLSKLTFDEAIKIVKPNLDYIKVNFKVKTLCLYGSIVKGVVNESSDIDFLVDFEDDLVDFEKGNYREKLTKFLKELLASKVDIVYFDHALTSLDIQEMNNLIVLIKPKEEK